jgi:acetyl esterase/lipase
MEPTPRDAGMASMFAGRQPDPDMAAVLRKMQDADPKPIETLDADEARRQPTPADAVGKLLTERGERADPEDVYDVDNRTIDGPGGRIALRIYKPASSAEGRPLPVVLYVHGGGWVIADLDVYDASPRALANAAHAVVVSTHYRQAPEHTFPAAHEDVYAVYRWVLAHAADFGGDAARVAVVGESAGGNLACVTCMNARDQGVPLPLHQVLVYPIAGYDTETESYREMTDAKPLNSAMMRWFFDHYLGDAAEGRTPAIDLVNADLAGLPPATIINAELDPLRTDGEQLAARLRAAGVAVEQRTFTGVTHEFFGMAPVVAKAREAQQMAATALRRAFGTA